MKGYISKDGKIGYRFFPKVACTTIKYALYEMEEGEVFSPQKVGMDVHRYTNKKKKSTIDQCERRFVVIRDPVKRFLSAYGNRVTFYHELSKKKVPEEIHHLIPFFDPTLDQFIEYFDSYLNQRSIFHHVRPISEFMKGEDLSYFSDIYKLEDLPYFESELCSLFGREVSFGREQTGGQKFSLKDLNKNQMEKLLRYYEQDYKLLHDYYSEKTIWQEWEKENNQSSLPEEQQAVVTAVAKDDAANEIKRPIISVLLPAYNAESHICRAVDSILSQTYRDFELIIIDDGSTDKTSEFITTQYKDPRIKHITLAENVGVVGALNQAIAMATGQYIARMDADDISRPERFLQQIQFLEANPDYVACGSSITIFNDKDPQYKVVYPNTHGEILAALQMFHRNISHPGVMIRSDVLWKHNIRYSNRYPHAEDYGLWKQLSEHGKLYNLKENLLMYSCHDEQISSKHYKTQIESSRSILTMFLNDFFAQENLEFSKNIYINFLVQERGNDHLVLSPAEATGAFRGLLAYVEKNVDIDTRYAKKIILYKYCLASFHYNHSFFSKIKTGLRCLLSSPFLMMNVVLENYRHFYFKKIKDSFKQEPKRSDSK